MEAQWKKKDKMFGFPDSTAQVTDRQTPVLLCPTHPMGTYLASWGDKLDFNSKKSHIHLAQIPSHPHAALRRPRIPEKQQVHTFLVGTLIFKNSASLASTCHGAWIRTKTDPWLLLCKVQKGKK